MAKKTGATCPSGVCDSCSQWSEWLELDHIIPRYRGGPHTRSNLQWLCVDCHKAKSSAERKAWKPTLEQLDRQRVAKIGKKASPETREKMRQSQLRRNQDPVERAKSSFRTPEGLARLRAAAAARQISEETREKMKASARTLWAERRKSKLLE